jgi:hypothetical protein
VKHYQGCKQANCPLCSFVRKSPNSSSSRSSSSGSKKVTDVDKIFDEGDASGDEQIVNEVAGDQLEGLGFNTLTQDDMDGQGPN